MLVGMHTHARYVRGRAHGCAWVCVEAGNPDLQYLHGRSNPDYAHCSNPDYTMLVKYVHRTNPDYAHCTNPDFH